MILNFQHGLKPSDVHTLTHLTKYNINIQLILNKTDRVP